MCQPETEDKQKDMKKRKKRGRKEGKSKEWRRNSNIWKNIKKENKVIKEAD